MKKGQKNERKKQERTLKKRSERKQKVAQMKAEAVFSDSPARIIRHARDYPIMGCWAQRDWDESGLAVILVARSQPDGAVVFGNYLVDYYCLGVKDTFCVPNISPDKFENEVLPRVFMGQPPLKIEPELAHEIVWGGVEYAESYGFRPHKDFKLSQNVLDPPETYPRRGKVEFGMDGKPFYIAGPRDNSAVIINRLMQTAGEGNFYYVLPGELPEAMYLREKAAAGVRSYLWLPRGYEEAEDEEDEEAAPRPVLWTPRREEEKSEEPRAPLWTPRS
jgi:hypothetical protein